MVSWYSIFDENFLFFMAELEHIVAYKNIVVKSVRCPVVQVFLRVLTTRERLIDKMKEHVCHHGKL